MKIAADKPVSNTSRAVKDNPSETKNLAPSSPSNPTVGSGDGFQASGELLGGGHEGQGHLPNLAAAFGSEAEAGHSDGHGLQPGGNHFDIPEGGFFGGQGLQPGGSHFDIPEGGLFGGQGFEPGGSHFDVPEGGLFGGQGFQPGQSPLGAFMGGLEHPTEQPPQPTYQEVMANFQQESYSATAEPSNSQVAVIEHDFSPNSHGDYVGEVLAQTTGDRAEDFQRVQMGETPTRIFELLTAEGPQTSEERVNTMLEANMTRAYNSGNAGLEAVLDSGNDNLQVVNQSWGTNALTHFSGIRDAAYLRNPFGQPILDENGERQLSPAGRTLFEGLGAPLDGSPESERAFSQAYFDRYEEISSTSSTVAEARERHVELSEEMRERGIAYVLASGNNQGEVDALTRDGIQVPEAAQTCLFANPHNIVVGALGTQGTQDPTDDRIWADSSQYGEVDFLAPGESIPIPSRQVSASGTSFSAPIFAGQVINTMRQNPDASLDEILSLVASSAGPEIAGFNVPALR